MSPFTTLGIPLNSSIASAEKAYRKLAMKYHPDRQGGNEAKFKEVKAAWERIQAGYRDPVQRRTQDFQDRTQDFQRTWSQPEAPSGTWRDPKTWTNVDDLLDELKQTSRRPGTTWTGPENEIVVNVSLREAFSGFNLVIPKRLHDGRIQQCSVNIPPGTPDGYRGKYTISDGSVCTITVRIETGDFHLRGFGDTNDLFAAGMEIGDIELEHQIDAIDLITGAWITVKDFLGEELKVRVPEGFNPIHRLKIAKKGYYGWSHGIGSIYLHRQNMYLKLIPVFNKPADIKRQKIIDLYNSVQET